MLFEREVVRFVVVLNELAQDRIASRANMPTYSLANAPLKAAQRPLAIAKKIHCVRTLHCPGARD